jgi:serine/threonine protein kinase
MLLDSKQMETGRNFHDWAKIKKLGEGGQSEVYLVRSPLRQGRRQLELLDIQVGVTTGQPERLGPALWSFAHSDVPSELGALKIYKIDPKGTSLPPPPNYEPVERLKNEISALNESLPGLPKLLDADEDERWIITEYFPEGTLEDERQKYRGRVVPALKAFRSLVQAVALIHNKGYVHRDIKPANVFVHKDELVLGDFGIVYVPNMQDRITATLERVGPRDYIPQWANLGTRLEKVKPSFDVYMLGKLLWSLVDGRAVLPREYYTEPEFDLTLTFRDDPDMYSVNSILKACLVERERDCLSSAQDLLLAIEKVLQIIERGGQLLKKDVPRPCHVCGEGFYKPETVFSNNLPPVRESDPVGLRFWPKISIGPIAATTLNVYPFVCDHCGHVELFARPTPGA